MQTELNKLKASKTLVRKALQRKTDMSIDTVYPNYNEYVKLISDSLNVDETGMLDYAEDRCYSLTLSVTRIRPYAFRDYTCLQQLYLTSSSVVTLDNVNAFYGCRCKIIVPSSLLSSYKSAKNWSILADRITTGSVTEDEQFLIQHTECQTVSWMNSRTVSELNKEFR